MRLAIHQPNFLPRLKVLQKLTTADHWIILDSVQFSQREWQNRARILPVDQKQSEFWLTLGVSLTNGQKTKIYDVRLTNIDKAKKKCRDSIRYSFRSSAYWAEVSNYWDEVESHLVSSSLLEIAESSMTVALQQYGSLPTKTLSSTLNTQSRKSHLMAEICERVGATEYLADSGSLRYLDISHFNKTIVKWQHWDSPIAKLSANWERFSFLSYLAYEGPNNLREHLHSGNFTNFIPHE